MQPATYERLFGYRHAFDHPVTVWIAIFAVIGIALAFAIIFALSAAGKLSPALREELIKRTCSWAVLAPLMIGPVLLGAAWTILAVLLLSILCYREFARATGFFRHRLLSAIVVCGIVLLAFAAFDHWYGLFAAAVPLTVIIIAAAAVFSDQPKGYVQRVALGIFAFLFFGACLGHLGYIANDADFRPIILMLLVTVELNDVFAYLCGKTFGRRKLAPQTSPNKTLGGSLGAIVLTTALAATIGHFVFRGDALDTTVRLLGLGLIISLAGQLGDLMLSSIKRDLGIKDMGTIIPGHGGLLDRFDSLLLVAPAVFHYVSYLRGIGLDQPTRILSGG